MFSFYRLSFISDLWEGTVHYPQISRGDLRREWLVSRPHVRGIDGPLALFVAVP